MITNFPELGIIRSGESFKLSCSASGVPTPSIQLYRNNEEIFKFTSGSVSLDETNANARVHHGTYNCTANSISKTTGKPFPTASESIQVIVQGLSAWSLCYGATITMIYSVLMPHPLYYMQVCLRK